MQSAGATVTTRAMTGVAPAVLYHGLYSDVGTTINWGNTPGPDTVAGVSTGMAQPLTVYGLMRRKQTLYPAPGAYTDTITVTVTY